MVLSYDVAVIGGSLGGVQAARAACESGMRVFLCEETDWIGGQMTSQAVPPDENQWIETQGATDSYRQFREDIRSLYYNDPSASDLLKEQRPLNPGKCWVSRIGLDPRMAHRLLTQSLQPYLDQGLLTLHLETRCVAAEVRDDQVISVMVEDSEGHRSQIKASYFLDATDKGDLLPITGTEYRVGAESREETGEPHAAIKADPADQQPITWVAALRLDKERTPMEKPADYDRFAALTIKDYPLLGWNAWSAHGLTHFAFYDNEPGASDLGLWRYRRIQYPPYFTDGRPEITLLNWPQNDYSFGNIIDDPLAEQHAEEAKELTKCCVYWLWEQGYPVRLDGTMIGTEDGLAKAPYIRESRRIVSRKTIVEQDITKEWNFEPRRLRDSVGVGHYAMDLHSTTVTRTSMYAATQPFEIPLNAMIPIRMRNLLPACKNIGATHLTGGCFRLHPVEWTIGEAAGYLAAYCVRNALTPVQVADQYLSDFQQLLLDHGFQLHWKDI